MHAEPSLGSGDDTATNGLHVRCRGPGLSGTNIEEVVDEGVTFSSSTWGSWSAECPAGMGICSIQTKIESDQGKLGDDTALDDVEFGCCKH